MVSDKRRSVELALAEWPKLSDRELARICAVGYTLVADVRNAQVPDSGTCQPQPRIGADGKERKPPTKPAPLPVAPAAEPAPVNTPSTAESQPDAQPDAPKTFALVQRISKSLPFLSELARQIAPQLPSDGNGWQFHRPDGQRVNW